MDIKSIVSAAVNIPGQTWPRELEWLADQFRDSKAHAEIGVFAGRSLYAAAAAMHGAAIYAIDAGDYNLPRYTEPGPGWTEQVFEATLHALESLDRDLDIRVVRSDSFEAARQLTNCGVELDSAFIDADHHFEAVAADIESFRPLIKSEGILAGHDYWSQNPGVMNAVQTHLPDFHIVPSTRIWWARLS